MTFEECRKKKKEEEERKKKTTAEVTPKRTFDEWRKEKYGLTDEDIAPSKKEATDKTNVDSVKTNAKDTTDVPMSGLFSGLMSDSAKNRADTVGKLNDEEEEKEDKQKWFDTSVFDDGYQWGDISKAILGAGDDAATFGDVTLNSLKRGYYNARYGEESYKAMGGVSNQKEFWEKKLSDEEYQFTPETKIASAISGAAELLGQMGRQFTNPTTIASVGTAVGGAALLGQAGPQVAIPEEILTVPTAATIGFTLGSANSSLQIEAGLAFNEMVEAGISEETARKIALAVGGVNATLEVLQVDELVNAYKITKATGATKTFTQKLLDELLDRGIVVAKETAQEVAQEGVTIAGVQAGSKIDNDEWAYSAEEVGDRLADTAQSSALSFGMLNAPATVNNTIKNGVNQKSAKLTENEQKVVDKEVENRIAEEEKDGKKLTGKEKSKIYDRVVEDMEKGYISIDTIEEVLGGDTYKSYKDAVDSEDALRAEYEELADIPENELTRNQRKRLDELEGQIEEAKAKTKSNQLKTQLGEEVFGLIKDDRLAESYNEKSRRGQAFEADLTQYDEKQRVTVQKAIDSGILNNTNKTHQFVDMIAKITADKGVSFDFTNNERLKESGFALDGKTINGYVTKDGIALNIQSEKALNSVVGHEISHILEGTELYTELQSAMFEYAKSKGDYQGRYDTLTELYKNIEGADINAELTADLVGDYLFTDADFIRKLSTEHRNVFQKIYDEIKYLCKVATAGSKEARELERVKKAFEDAYRADGKAIGDTKYSMAGLNAKTSNSSMLLRAEHLLDAGVDSDTVRQETGWYKGYDGKMRFEIDDSEFEYYPDGYSKNPDVIRARELHKKLQTGEATEGDFNELRSLLKKVDFEEVYPTKLFDLVVHKKLFEAYPQLKDVKVSVYKLGKNTNGHYDPNTKTIALNEDLINNDAEAKRTLIHEIQHAIQDVEGFARGSSIGYWQQKINAGYTIQTAEQKADLKETEDKLYTIYKQNPEFYTEMTDLLYNAPDMPRGEINWETLEPIEEDPAEWVEFDKKRDALEEKYGSLEVFDFIDLYYDVNRLRKKGLAADDAYYNTAGEIEARDVSNRLNLNAEERRNKRPDIDNKRVVFADVKYSLTDNAGKQLSKEQQDKTYLDAVNRGDTATAQKMVYDAAKEAGYARKMFHETKDENIIHIFDLGLNTNASADYETPFGVFTKSHNRSVGLGGKQMGLYVKAENTFKLKDRTEIAPRLPAEYSELVATIKAIDEEYVEKTEGLDEDFLFAFSDWLDENDPNDRMRNAWDVTKTIEEQFGDVVPQEIIDLERKYTRTMDEWREKTNKAILEAKEWLTKWLRDNNYDSMELEFDNGAGGRVTDALIVLDPNQVKSAEPVTYDDNGNVVPLSKRFNAAENDIRYSLSKQGETPRKFGNYGVYGNDIALEFDEDFPIRDDIGPVQQDATTEAVNPPMPVGVRIAVRDIAEGQDHIPESQIYNWNIKKDASLGGVQPVVSDSSHGASSDASVNSIPENVPVVNMESVPIREEIKTAEKVANVLVDEPKVAKKKNSVWSLVKEYVLDNGMVFEDISKKTKNRNLEAKWNFVRYSRGMAQYLMENGADGVKSLDSVRKVVEASGKTQQFQEYMYHRHNIDRMTLEQRYEGAKNKTVFGDSVTADVSRATVARMEEANPEFKELAQDVYAYNEHLRKLLVDGGLISQETADLWAEMYPHYVPVRRAGDAGRDINVPLDTRRTGVNAPVKQATGGNSDIAPLFETMAERTLQTMTAITKNRFGVELKNALGSVVDSTATSVDDAIDGIDNQDGLLQEGKGGNNPTFTVFENGERVTFEITEEMYEAMKPAGKLLSMTFKPTNIASGVHRGVLTEYNPVFMITNAIKDAQDVLVNSQHPLKTYLTFPRSIKELASKGKWYTEYVSNGGEQNTYFDSETNTFAKENKVVEAIMKWTGLGAISKANNFIERVPRMAEYIASREAGRSVEESMLDAARVTTNFAAGGKLTKALNRNGVTFLNASMQGFVQQVRNVREAKMNGLKGALVLAAKYAAAGLPFVLLNGLRWDDDEDYEELSDYVKDNYYIVAKYGDGQFVRIPKGRMLAVIQNAFEQVGNAITGEDEVDLQRFSELLISNIAPNNPLDNNILAPIVQVAQNKTWYGEDLVPTRLQDVPVAEQYDESTDAISKWLGEKLNFSPYKINYLLDQYTGGVGDTVLPMLTPEAESGDDSFIGNMLAPLKDKFTTDVVMNNQNISNFYDTVDELTVNANSSRATDEDVLKSKYINSVNGDIGKLYQQKREIQNSQLPNDEKYEQVREIQRQIDEMAKESLDNYNNVSIDGNYATVGDTHYRWYEPSADSDAEAGWQKITDKQLAKQKEVTSGLGISAADYWGNKEEYDYAFDYPGKYAVSQAVGGYSSYKTYSKALSAIESDKDKNGKSVSGSRKKKVVEYINGLDADYGEKIILFRSQYTGDDTYNYDIVEYLNNRDDISYTEMKTILEELGFTVNEDGTINW